MKDPKVCILTNGVRIPVSPKSYANFPLVKVGQDFGSQAITLISFFSKLFSKKRKS